MSLINDALKKAQRQRTEGTTPPTEASTPGSPSPEPLQRVARREKPAGFRSQLMLIAGGTAAAVIVLAVGAVFFFRSGEQLAEKSKPTPPASTVATTPVAAQAPAAVSPATPVTTVAPSVTLPAISANPANPTSSPAQPIAAAPVAAAPNPEPAPATPATSAPAQFVIPTPAPVASTPVTPPPAASATAPAVIIPPKASTRMISVIEHFRVGGIRVAGTESKVLMNDRVYRINDTVDHELNIRLTSIEAKALTFEDARGAVYTRQF